MPYQYAHYRFGSEQRKNLPAPVLQAVEKHPQLYHVGLSGPDPFFCLTGGGVDLARRIHREPGRNFFEYAACVLPRGEPEGLAYLAGALSHYCLDSLCHPLINESHGKAATHVEIETEFDRFLLENDGLLPPERQPIGRHLKLSRREGGLACRFYPGLTPAQMAAAVRNMRLLTGLLAAPAGAVRRLAHRGVGAVSRTLGGYFMIPGGDERCRRFNEPLLELYRRAAEHYPRLLHQLLERLDRGTPLGEDFSPIFG